MKFTKKCMAVLLALALVLALAACGGSSEPDPNAGVYEAKVAEISGFQVDVSTVYSQGLSIELKNGGKCSITVDGKTGSAKWTLEDGVLTVSDSQQTLTGKVADGIITLNMGEDAYIYLLREGATLPDDTSGSSVAEPSWLEGEWYGWWVIDEADGEYAKFVDGWWDLCAEVTPKDGNYVMKLWDEDYSRQEPMGEVTFVVMGETAASLSGNFWHDELSTPWMMDHSSSGYENMLVMKNGYWSDDTGSFVYHVFLRPWGVDWDDVATDPKGTLGYKDMLPYYYNDWYTRLVEAGIGMPDVIMEEGWENLLQPVAELPTVPNAVS